MARTETEVPDVEELLDMVVPDGTSLGARVSERQQRKDLIAQLEKDIEDDDKYIAAVLDLNGLRTVTANGFLISRREGSAPRQTLSREKLLELGVPPTTIAQATLYGEPGRPGITVRRVRNGKQKE